MKDLIWQTWVGNNPVPEYARQSINHFKKYAQTHDLEYMFDTDNYFEFTFDQFHLDTNSHAVLSKLRPLFDEKFDNYNNVLIADTDILINIFTRNIFLDIKKPINGVSYILQPNLILEAVKNRVDPSEYPDKYGLKGFRVSGGMLILTREFRRYARQHFHSPGQYAADEVYYMRNIPNPDDVYYMNFRWNFNCKLYEFYKEPFFIHFHGKMKKYMDAFYFTGNFVMDDEDRIQYLNDFPRA